MSVEFDEKTKTGKVRGKHASDMINVTLRDFLMSVKNAFNDSVDKNRVVSVDVGIGKSMFKMKVEYLGESKK